jgi:hypothetical protein
MNPIKAMVYALLGVVAVGAGPQSPLQGQNCGTCGQSCPVAPACPSPPNECCHPCTVLVPQTVIEFCPRTITCYRQETRQRMVTVYRDVPTTKTEEEHYTVMVPEVRRRTVVDTINRPVYRDLELRVTAMAPQIEVRQATRTVCRMVPVQEEKTVCETVDRTAAASPVVIHTVGYQRETTVDALPPATTPQDRGPGIEVESSPPPPPPGPAGAAACSTCGQPACNTCAPAVIQRKVCVTCMKPVAQQETIQYAVSQFQPKPRTETVSFYEFQTEKVPREEEYTVEVPQQRVRTREVTVMQTVAEQQPQPYTVTIPYEKQIQVPVPVLRWVAQPAAPSCGNP